MKERRDLTDAVRRLRLVVFDFDGVFTDNRVFVLQDGSEAVVCTRADGLGLERLRTHGLDLLVLSKERNRVVATRCEKLRLPYIQGCDEKASRLEQEVRGRGISLREVAYLGNDINDLDCMAQVGLPAAVSDAYPEVLEKAAWISNIPGGKGAVREFCDWVAGILESES
jgi:3-deoxy-D-manno-octulosonate 8-phosphate phosphatase (KDO 8-P phosphatase)